MNAFQSTARVGFRRTGMERWKAMARLVFKGIATSADRWGQRVSQTGRYRLSHSGHR